MLVGILKGYKIDLGWMVSIINGTSPLVCMYQILMEDYIKPSTQIQCQLNPIMIEVENKQVLKLLFVGFIDLISDGSWISPNQIVTKKKLITMVENEK